MRIAEFTLERYGPFDELRLSLATEPGQITLLFAPNGFGKSVIRRALGDLLFDFPHHSPMAFRFAAPQMRLHARLIAEDGTARTVIRRKGRGNTLTDGAETPVPLEDLRRLIGKADRPLF